MFGAAIAQTYCASSDGGYTESVQNVWGGSAQAYLVGIPDPFDGISPEHLWRRPPRFTGAQLGHLLGTGGVVSGVTVLRRGVSPRVVTARVELVSGRRIIMSGSRIASDLGLPSTWVWVWGSYQPRPREPSVMTGAGASRSETTAAASPPAGAGTPPAGAGGGLVPSETPSP